MKFWIDTGDLLYSWSATLGAFIWPGPRAYVNQHIFKVVPRAGVDRDYLYHLLQHVTHDLEAKTHGSTMKHVTKGDFDGTLVPLPSIEGQRVIADILNHMASIRRLQGQSQAKSREVVPAVSAMMFSNLATDRSAADHAQASMAQLNSRSALG